MKDRKLWLFTIGAMAVLVGIAVASNMGFKLNYGLTTNAVGNNINWVSLPYFNNFTDANGIISDVNGDCGAGTATRIIRFDTASNSFVTQTPGGKNNFALTAGTSYGVEVSNPCTWIIVGSHDDTYDPGGTNSVSLVTNATGNNINWVSVPYHTTSSTAQDLCTEVGATATSIKYFDTANNSFTTVACGGKNNFSLTPGLGVGVEVSANTTWNPSHY